MPSFLPAPRPIAFAARLLCLTISSTLLCQPALADDGAAVDAAPAAIQAVHVASTREENAGFGATREQHDDQVRPVAVRNGAIDLGAAARPARFTSGHHPERSDNVTQRQDTSSTTGNAALSYVLTPNIIPYVSYATSFLPVSGSDFFGVQFKPEEGRQAEVGSKFQFAGGRVHGAVAMYDLTRTNVTTADPDPAHIAMLSSAQVQTGEQRTRGFEAEISADLRNGWSVQGALTVLDARVTEDNGGTVGRRLLNTPRQSANVWANYRFRVGAMDGWTAGLGARHEAGKTGPAVNYTVSGYTVADASLTCQGRGYRLSLNVKNLFDKEYYAGVLNANVLPLGDPRVATLKAVFDF